MSELAEDIPREIVEAIEPGRFARPTARQWALHLGLFVLTGITTTISGIAWLPVDVPTSAAPTASDGGAGSIALIPWYYVRAVLYLMREALAHPSILAPGLKFSISLLAILAAHEAGHYLFCRYYRVDATLPFFIPQPPLLIPGTFGAFIRMKSALPSRRALFDIGLAGPLAGFVVIVPVAIAGLLTAHIVSEIPSGPGVITFEDPLLLQLIARAVGVKLAAMEFNPYYLAAWFGMLVTSLNLMPVGQLDGGHGTFAAFGPRAHWWIGRIAFVTLAALSVLGYLWHGSPSGFVYVVLLAVMLRVRHPQPEQMEPLGALRIAIGIVTLIVFALCFLPFPITIT
jgi:membrane-associated protease RseP (regulator of RpoE activity)